MKVLLTKRRLFGLAKSPLIHEGGWILAFGSTLEFLTMIFSHKIYQKEKQKIQKNLFEYFPTSFYRDLCLKEIDIA